MVDRLDFAIESFKNIQDLIRFTDQKASAALVVAGLVLSGHIGFAKDLQFTKSPTGVGIVAYVASCLTAIAVICTIYLVVFRVIKPRLAKSYSNNERSLLYFEHLLVLGKEGIREKYKNLTEEEMLEYVIDQQYEISSILERKIRYFNVGLYMLSASVVLLIILIICATRL